jgi:Zn-dependent peptidase ImmA (M78 family)
MKGMPLGGGFRNRVANGRTKILLPSSRPTTQRFFLARMIGAAHVLAPEEHLIPVTDSDSALQTLERAFAQEFLCPWAALDAFTNEHGVGDDALNEAAEHFQVSEWTVRSTLVNRGKISRDRLPSAV